MMTPDDYVGRCRGLVISLSDSLPPDEVNWAMHLIDHDEPAEGLNSLAWSIESLHDAVDPKTASAIRELTDGLVPLDTLPPSLQTQTAQTESYGGNCESE